MAAGRGVTAWSCRISPAPRIGGIDRQGGAIETSAYGRIDYLAARLDRYTEVGGDIYGLTFGLRDLQSVASVLGARFAFPMAGWTPRVRGEWRHEFGDADAQLVDLCRYR
ncbi:autotransporter outer membrane beta-barrel domain-containing protein [Sphingomonas oligophenolica]|uniref:Autotransporter outer membrane beta-barrel domain-containing protein n=1 Tax=Sphingomonas oligophenolica TaxID=301154 RepID=A0A502C9W8_9SPHN|nr:autotransporter outer membrane beta-barrel domain-containing protein [Sphingomonas oligophenolica]